MTLLFFDSAPEIIFILVVALIIFGPRKLPELSRSLGKSLSEFKRASDEFKRTWEREVNLESYDRERRVGEAMLPPEERRAEEAAGNLIAPPAAAPEQLIGADTVARGGGGDGSEPSSPAAGPETVATVARAGRSDGESAGHVAPQPPNKVDWL